MILLPQCGQSLTIIEVIDPSVWRLYPYNDQKIKQVTLDDSKDLLLQT
jgi:hypothetical protein